MIGKDNEFNESLEELQSHQEKRLNVARERYRLAAESVKEEYQATVLGIQEELDVNTLLACSLLI